MNAPHIIRLRGPWQRTITEGPELPRVKVMMPANWSEDLGQAFTGVVEYQRFFNQPTGLVASTRVFLTLEQVVGDALTVSLNETELGTVEKPAGKFTFDVARLLQKRNDLRVRIGANGATIGGLTGEVRLEIG